jgi:hypothetical protein
VRLIPQNVFLATLRVLAMHRRLTVALATVSLVSVVALVVILTIGTGTAAVAVTRPLIHFPVSHPSMGVLNSLKGRWRPQQVSMRVTSEPTGHNRFPNPDVSVKTRISKQRSEHRAPWHESWDNSIAICAVMRNENITDVVEWVSYYKCVSRFCAASSTKTNGRGALT